ncbi:MAG: tRNA (N(6)-L-threonylcarbamoyladenosine(37)-C(2))-methylthiotransferase MtaB [Oscillospiraceae bacterium]|nr:tRNA (N(6)-L-threonylcarbamoyladenosine(37)-C(2))-methylthiotransferase MtaB [Oscillospiraceae bacterium]
MTVAFVTLGCKVNQVDSQLLRQKLCAAGFLAVEPEASPEVLVLNSCAVTAESERKTRQKLRQFRKLNRDAVLVLTGCAAQCSKTPAQSYPEADLILGHRDALRLHAHIQAFLRSGQRQVLISPHQRGETFDADDLPTETQHTRARIKLEDGCDRFCSYCIIPRARGHVRSKPLPALREELHTLADAGFVEVVLVGVNLTAYGSDLGCTLADAVELTAAFPSIRRIRLGSLEPDRLTPKIIESLSRIDALCHHFHLSLQSGCDKTLRAMNRNYSPQQYFDLANHLRNVFSDSSVTTDLMVGFPGETEEDFAASLTFVEQIGFAKVHVFPYSARPGTRAAGMPQQLPRAQKLLRCQCALESAQRLRRRFLESQICRTVPVLLEETHPAGGMRGYSENYTPVHVRNAPADARNEIVTVYIDEVKDDECAAALL